MYSARDVLWRGAGGRLRALSVALALAAPGCSGEAVEPRCAWLQSTLVADNLILMRRDSDLVAGKFVKMASGLFPYMRGTAKQYLRDATESAVVPSETAFGSAGAARVLLVGDPHPENVGAFLTSDGEMTLEFNDFDGAVYGPFHLDLRRLAIGFYALGVAANLEPETLAAMVHEVSRGYADEIAAPDGEAIQIRAGAGFGEVIDDLLQKARIAGDTEEPLMDYTRIEDDRREMFFGDVGTPEDAFVTDRVVPLRGDEVDLVSALVRRLDERRGGEATRVKGMSRRLGAGVTSYPLLRYYVLVDGSADGVADDYLLELREVQDPFLVNQLPRYATLPFASNGERVVFAQQAIHEASDHDPHLGWAGLGALSVRVRWHTGYQRALDAARIVDKIAEETWDGQDVAELAYWAGRLLARGHAQALTETGSPAGAVIREAVDGDWDGLIAETDAYALAYGGQLRLDYELFLQMLESDGPLLGGRAREGAP